MKKTPTSPARKRKLKLKKPIKTTVGNLTNQKISVTPEKSAAFLVAIENGFTLKEALQEAKITDDSYRRHLKRSAEFRAGLQAAEMKLVMLARSKLASAINAGDMPTVRWFLERKVPAEFRPSFGDGDLPVIGNITVIVPGGKHPRFTPQE